ncbi:50S ribosomal protein L3-1 [Hibiscus syriacus]|uniref:Large ribosomal subunit protein uL3c n=1 Tax=Hibiscus syriacus TaxID=106335 RepID=A0A6A3BCX4_HIBSY|nr:50S ribosomal protein L3-1 [Hibiscus syriacus]
MSTEAGIGVMGTKLGMMSYFETDGIVVPVTVVGFREGNIVTQVKTSTTDDYDVVQVGYRRVRDKKLTKPELGHLGKAGVIPMRYLQEFRLQIVEEFETGQKLAVEEIFKEDSARKAIPEHLTSKIDQGKDKRLELTSETKVSRRVKSNAEQDRSVLLTEFNVTLRTRIRVGYGLGVLHDVSGTTIGKGFQGGIKRHNFKRGQISHGSKSHRALGSIGAGTTPGRVYKGKKMPGRMGGSERKIRKLKIVKIDSELRVVMIKGDVPGKPGNLLRITLAKIVGKNIPKN